jgi:tetratricopeptide (TPR) repeat protein
MIACPTEDELRELLDEFVDAADFPDLVDHIETCGKCQARLKSLTSDDLWKTAVAFRDSARAGAGSAGQTTIELDGEATSDLPNCAGVRALRNVLEPGAGRTSGSSNVQPASLCPSDRPLIPGFEVIEKLGEGGMGIVYKARQLGLDRLVALKVIRGGAHARPAHLARLGIEAEAVARLRHPNVVQIYDIGEAEGLPYMVFELLDGGSLETRVARAPQPGGFAAELLATLARAVHLAHQAGIIHRDLKPTNVLFTQDGVPKITDFGLAKRLESDDRHTLSGEIMGSPSYLAPEQARGHSREVGPAADVYALGAILYRVLTGRPPFAGGTAMETVSRVLDEDVVPPRRLAPRLHPDLETICLMCLAKDPSKRYGSAQALADDLERYLKDQPVRARRTPFWMRWAKRARRRPAAATLVVIGIAAILGPLIGGLQYGRFLRGQDQREKARISALRADSNERFLKAHDAWGRNDLTKARLILTALREKLVGQQEMRDLAERTDSLFRKIEDRLAAERADGADRARYDVFRRLRSEALRHDTQFTGLELHDNRDATRRAARAALDQFAAPGSGSSWELASLPTGLLLKEWSEITDGCYELLLILADAEPTPEEGLRRLDQAARLRPPTTAYYQRREACLRRKGDLAGAETARRQADQLRPTTAFDHFLIGQERFTRRDPKAAIQHFNATLELEPDHFWAQCLSAVCALQLPSPGEAKARLNACLQRERGSAWLYLLRGFASGQVAAAALDLMKKYPDQEKSLQVQADLQFAAAEDDYRRALQLLEQRPSDELHYILLVNRGVLWLQRRVFDKAAGYLQEAIRLNAREPEAFAALAQVYQKQEKADEAFDQYSRAIALRPDRAVFYRGRADVDRTRRDSTSAQRARALRDLEQAIRLEEPGNRVLLARDHTQRAKLLHLDHREDEALAACESALKIVPDSDEAHGLRIAVLLKLKRLADAIRSCDSLLSREKPSASLYELRGLARSEIKDYPGAISDTTQALALMPEKTRLLCRRGWLYIVSDAPVLALHDFEEAVGRDHSDSDAYSGRGFARLRLGEHRQAVADAEEALRFGEPDARQLYNAARTYALAATVAAADVRKKGWNGATLVSQYQDRGASLLRAAVQRLPSSERASFWRDVVQTDPTLSTIRRRVSSVELAGQAESSAVPGN